MRRRTEAAILTGALAALTACGMPDPDTPLASAAARGRAQDVRALLAQGADPNQKDGNGLPPLVWAARLGHVEAVKALLEGGADQNLRDSFVNGWTAMMHAVHKGQKETVRALLDWGADVNARTDNGVSALMLATCEEDNHIVRMLPDRGAHPRGETSDGGSALLNAVAAGQTANVRALLEKDPDLRLKNDIKGRLSLWLARLRGRSEIVSLLEMRDVSPSLPSGAGRDRTLP